MPDQTEPKWIVTSKTFLGLLITVLPVLAPILGFSFGEGDAEFVSQGADQLIQAVGVLVAGYGRFAAKSPVSILPKVLK